MIINQVNFDEVFIDLKAINEVLENHFYSQRLENLLFHLKYELTKRTVSNVLNRTQTTYSGY